MLFNFRRKSTKVAVAFAQYIAVSTYGFFSHVYVTTAGDVTADTYFSIIRDLIELVTRHTLLRLNRLSDIVVYDRPQFRMRFVLNYILTNSFRELKVRFRFYADAYYAITPSIVTVVSAASWAEREAMDLFGVKFSGHPDLRRILGDYGLFGFPGRKDFPLVGQFSYFYSLNFLRVFRIRGTLQDFWSLYFQKKIYNKIFKKVIYSEGFRKVNFTKIKKWKKYAKNFKKTLIVKNSI